MLSPTLRLGDTEVPRIGLGNRLTNTLEHVNFVKQAFAAGVRHIDTAHLYTGGESEATIGAALSPIPEDCMVATKGGFRPGEGRPEVLRAQIEESLRRLRTDSIALYYLHRVDPKTPLEDSLGATKTHRDSGKIGHIGVCEVEIDQIERARQIVPISPFRTTTTWPSVSTTRWSTTAPPRASSLFPSSRYTEAAAARAP